MRLLLLGKISKFDGACSVDDSELEVKIKLIQLSSLPFLKDRTGFVTISTKSLQSRRPDNHLTQLHQSRAKTILNWIDR